MFLENANRAGWVEVICGSMFSGKTEELIRRLKRAQFARQRVEIFKPQIDIRYSETDVVSHDDHAIRSTPVENSGNILLLTGEVDVVGIDEAQFLIQTLSMYVNNWRTKASGLSLPVWIWTTWESLSVPCLNLWPLPNM